ncbi:hypothetical protein D3C71_1615240 [compost metagenome]
MCRKAFLQFTHGKVQKQLNEIADDEQLHDQQSRVRLALLGQKRHHHQETKGCRPRLEQPEGLDGQPYVGSVNSVMIINNRQCTNQQQQHDHIIGGNITKLIID